AYVTAPATGYPLCIVAPMLAREIAVPLYYLGETLLVSGCCLYLFFTAKVFRPAAPWAMWTAAAGTVVLALCGVQNISAFTTAHAQAEVVAKARLGVAPMVAILGLYYVWTTFEGFRYYGMMKKRMALGLADAVVTNRFLLWGFAGIVSFAWNSVSAMCL